MTSEKENSIIIATKCFCGRNILTQKNNLGTCGSPDCNQLAEKFGSVTNWLISNANEIGKINIEKIDLSKIENKIVKFLMANSSKDVGITQKTIAEKTNLAKSTVSKTLNELVKKGIVIKNEFFTEYGNWRKKGKDIALYYLDL